MCFGFFAGGDPSSAPGANNWVNVANVAAIQALAAGSSLADGTWYYAQAEGIAILATSSSTVDELGLLNARNPDYSLYEVWYPSLIPNLGTKYVYNGQYYENQTGANDPFTTPDLDPTNWGTAIAYADDPTLYVATEWDTIWFDLTTGRIFGRMDNRGNRVYCSLNYVGSVDPINRFQWGASTVTGNIVEGDSLLDCINNYNLVQVANNTLTGGASLYLWYNSGSVINNKIDSASQVTLSGRNTGSVAYNSFTVGASLSFTDYAGAFFFNELSGSSSIQDFGTATPTQFYYNTLTGGSSILASGAGSASCSNNRLSNLSSINIASAQGSISNNILTNNCTLNCTNNGAINSIIYNVLMNSCTITCTNNTGTIRDNILEAMTCNWSDNSGTIQYNNADTGLMTGTSNAGIIEYNVFHPGVVFTFSNNAGTFTTNIVYQSELTITGAHAGTIRSCTIGSQSNGSYGTGIGIYVLDKNAGVTMRFCTITAYLNITVDPSTADTGYRCENGYSNFPYSLDVDAALAAGVLTIPAALNYIGVFTLISTVTASPFAVNQIVNLPANHPNTFKTQAGKTTTFTPTAVGVAVATDIVSDAGAANIVGRANGSDEYVIVLDGNVNKKISSVILI